MNEKKKKREGGWRWEQNKRLSQALGLGWGLRLGEWALALTARPGGGEGVSLHWGGDGGGRMGLAGRPQAYPPCLVLS